MQAQPTSAMTTAARSAQPSMSAYSRVSAYEQNNLDISYSDGTSSIRLSLSSSYLSEAVLYTEQGTFDSLPPVEPVDTAETAIASADSAETEETDDAQTVMLQEILNRYQLLTARRVMDLLRAIAEESRRISGEDSAATAVSNSSETITMYSEETTVVDIDMTVESTAPISDAFSAENTASRIVNFALSFYDGGDREAYAEKIKTAVMKGFELAKGALGGWAPQVSYDTISLATSAIDQWASGGMELTA